VLFRSGLRQQLGDEMKVEEELRQQLNNEMEVEEDLRKQLDKLKEERIGEEVLQEQLEQERKVEEQLKQQLEKTRKAEEDVRMQLNRELAAEEQLKGQLMKKDASIAALEDEVRELRSHGQAMSAQLEQAMLALSDATDSKNVLEASNVDLEEALGQPRRVLREKTNAQEKEIKELKKDFARGVTSLQISEAKAEALEKQVDDATSAARRIAEAVGLRTQKGRLFFARDLPLGDLLAAVEKREVSEIGKEVV